MDAYCNDCGADGKPMVTKPNGHSICDDCRYEELMAA